VWWQPWAGREQWASNHIYWSIKYCGLNSLPRHHYFVETKSNPTFCVCVCVCVCVCGVYSGCWWKTLQNPERIKNLDDINSDIEAAMPYGLWQGSPLIKSSKEKTTLMSGLYPNLAKVIALTPVLNEMQRLCFGRLSEATCQDGTSQTSMYNQCTWKTFGDPTLKLRFWLSRLGGGNL